MDEKDLMNETNQVAADEEIIDAEPLIEEDSVTTEVATISGEAIEAAEEAPVDPEATLSLDELPEEAPVEDNADTSETYASTESFGGSTDASQSTYNEQSTYDGQNRYNGQNSYEDAGVYGYAASGAGYQSYARATQHKPGYITKRAFILILILAMLLTMLASVGITTAYTLYLNNKSNANGHATNYTLTTSDESLSYKSIIEKTQDSVVSITTESVSNDMWLQNYVTQGAGSGVIIQSDGYIITCEHVIEGARKVTVTLRNGKEYEAKIIGADADNDIAVIKIDAKNLQEATYGDSSKLVVGDQVVAIGNPLGTLSGTATTGIISALNRNLTIDNRTLNLFQTDASINPGNSGGGMFDTSGNLIGIVEAKSTGSDIDGLGFATPINKAAKIAKKIIETGKDIKSNGKSGSTNQSVIIGIMVAPVDEQTAKEYGYAHGGLLIKSVNSDEANKAGLQNGDIIFKADGETIKTNDDLSKILAKKKEGDTVKLSIARENGLTSVIQTKLISATSTH